MEKLKISDYVKTLNTKLDKKINVTSRRDKIAEWKKELKQHNKDNFFRIFCLLNKIYQEEKFLDSNYTVRQLALDTEMEEQYVYKILKFKYANSNLKELVLNGKVGFSIALRILCGEKSRQEQDKVVEYVISNNLTNSEVEKYLVTYNEKTIKQLRQTKDKGNTLRDFFLYSNKLLALLPLLDKTNFQIGKKVEITRQLVTLVNEINKVKMFK